jgi:hypothetical protein
MPDSWRRILERAAENLSIELDDKAAAGFSLQASARTSPQASARTVFQRQVLRPRSIAESRALLARELETISAQPLAAPAPIVKPVKRARRQAEVRQPAANSALPAANLQPPQAPKGRAGGSRNFTVLSISALIVVLSVYAIYQLLH